MDLHTLHDGRKGRYRGIRRRHRQGLESDRNGVGIRDCVLVSVDLDI